MIEGDKGDRKCHCSGDHLGVILFLGVEGLGRGHRIGILQQEDRIRRTIRIRLLTNRIGLDSRISDTSPFQISHGGIVWFKKLSMDAGKEPSRRQEFDRILVTAFESDFEGSNPK